MKYPGYILVDSLDRAEHLTVLEGEILIGGHGGLWDELHQDFDGRRRKRDQDATTGKGEGCHAEPVDCR